MTFTRKLALVVIPVINEYQNLLILLPMILENQKNVDVLIIDDLSTDKTSLYVSDLQRKYGSKLLYIFNEESFGIGGAHLQGLRFAHEHNYDFAITMDGDLTHDPADVQRLIHETISNPKTDLVIGSRFLPGSRINGWTFLRILLTYAGHFFTFVTLQMKQDLSSGLRIYKVNSVPNQLLSIKNRIGYEYFALSAYMYKLNEMKISEIAVTLNARGKGKSKLTLIKAVRSIYNTVRLRIFVRK